MKGVGFLQGCISTVKSFVCLFVFPSFIVKADNKKVSCDYCLLLTANSLQMFTLFYIIYSLLIDQFFHIIEGPILQKILFSESCQTNFYRDDFKLSFKLNNKIDCKST